MLIIFMCGKEKRPRVQLIQNTPDRPDIRFMVPSHTVENHLRTSILPCVDDGAVMFVVPRSSSHVNEFYFGGNGLVSHSWF
jgi:hypothetical protein